MKEKIKMFLLEIPIVSNVVGVISDFETMRSLYFRHKRLRQLKSQCKTMHTSKISYLNIAKRTKKTPQKFPLPIISARKSESF
jgi:hypothetical protein